MNISEGLFGHDGFLIGRRSVVRGGLVLSDRCCGFKISVRDQDGFGNRNQRAFGEVTDGPVGGAEADALADALPRGLGVSG